MKLSKGKIRRLLKKRKESKSNNYKRKKGKISDNTKNNKKKRHLANKTIHNKRSKKTISAEGGGYIRNKQIGGGNDEGEIYMKYNTLMLTNIRIMMNKLKLATPNKSSDQYDSLKVYINERLKKNYDKEAEAINNANPEDIVKYRAPLNVIYGVDKQGMIFNEDFLTYLRLNFSKYLETGTGVISVLNSKKGIRPDGTIVTLPTSSTSVHSGGAKNTAVSVDIDTQDLVFGVNKDPPNIIYIKKFFQGASLGFKPKQMAKNGTVLENVEIIPTAAPARGSNMLNKGDSILKAAILIVTNAEKLKLPWLIRLRAGRAFDGKLILGEPVSATTNDDYIKDLRTTVGKWEHNDTLSLAFDSQKAILEKFLKGTSKIKIHEVENDITKLFLLSNKAKDSISTDFTRKNQYHKYWWASTEFLAKPSIEEEKANAKASTAKAISDDAQADLDEFNTIDKIRDEIQRLFGIGNTYQIEFDIFKFTMQAGSLFNPDPTSQAAPKQLAVATNIPDTLYHKPNNIKCPTVANGIIASRRLESDGKDLIGETVRIIGIVYLAAHAHGSSADVDEVRRRGFGRNDVKITYTTVDVSNNKSFKLYKLVDFKSFVAIKKDEIDKTKDYAKKNARVRAEFDTMTTWLYEGGCFIAFMDEGSRMFNNDSGGGTFEIRPGDKITKVDDEDTSMMSASDVEDLLTKDGVRKLEIRRVEANADELSTIQTSGITAVNRLTEPLKNNRKKLGSDWDLKRETEYKPLIKAALNVAAPGNTVEEQVGVASFAYWSDFHRRAKLENENSNIGTIGIVTNVNVNRNEYAENEYTLEILPLINAGSNVPVTPEDNGHEYVKEGEVPELIQQNLDKANRKIIKVNEMDVEVVADHLSDSWCKKYSIDELKNALKRKEKATDYYTKYFKKYDEKPMWWERVHGQVEHPTTRPIAYDNYKYIRKIAEITGKSLDDIYLERYTQEFDDMKFAAKFSMLYATSYYNKLVAANELFKAKVEYQKVVAKLSPEMVKFEKILKAWNTIKFDDRLLEDAKTRLKGNKTFAKAFWEGLDTALYGEDPATGDDRQAQQQLLEELDKKCKNVLDAEHNRKVYHDNLAELRHKRRVHFIEKAHEIKYNLLFERNKQKLIEEIISEGSPPINRLSDTTIRNINFDEYDETIKKTIFRARAAGSCDLADNYTPHFYSSTVDGTFEKRTHAERFGGPALINIANLRNTSPYIRISEARRDMEKSGVIIKYTKDEAEGAEPETNQLSWREKLAQEKIYSEIDNVISDKDRTQVDSHIQNLNLANAITSNTYIAMFKYKSMFDAYFWLKDDVKIDPNVALVLSKYINPLVLNNLRTGEFIQMKGANTGGYDTNLPTEASNKDVLIDRSIFSWVYYPHSAASSSRPSADGDAADDDADDDDAESYDDIILEDDQLLHSRPYLDKVKDVEIQDLTDLIESVTRKMGSKIPLTDDDGKLMDSGKDVRNARAGTRSAANMLSITDFFIETKHQPIILGRVVLMMAINKAVRALDDDGSPGTSDDDEAPKKVQDLASKNAATAELLFDAYINKDDVLSKIVQASIAVYSGSNSIERIFKRAIVKDRYSEHYNKTIEPLMDSKSKSTGILDTAHKRLGIYSMITPTVSGRLPSKLFIDDKGKVININAVMHAESVMRQSMRTNNNEEAARKAYDNAILPFFRSNNSEKDSLYHGDIITEIKVSSTGDELYKCTEYGHGQLVKDNAENGEQMVERFKALVKKKQDRANAILQNGDSNNPLMKWFDGIAEQIKNNERANDGHLLKSYNKLENPEKEDIAKIFIRAMIKAIAEEEEEDDDSDGGSGADEEEEDDDDSGRDDDEDDDDDDNHDEHDDEDDEDATGGDDDDEPAKTVAVEETKAEGDGTTDDPEGAEAGRDSGQAKKNPSNKRRDKVNTSRKIQQTAEIEKTKEAIANNDDNDDKVSNGTMSMADADAGNIGAANDIIKILDEELEIKKEKLANKQFKLKKLEDELNDEDSEEIKETLRNQIAKKKPEIDTIGRNINKVEKKKRYLTTEIEQMEDTERQPVQGKVVSFKMKVKDYVEKVRKTLSDLEGVNAVHAVPVTPERTGGGGLVGGKISYQKVIKGVNYHMPPVNDSQLGDVLKKYIGQLKEYANNDEKKLKKVEEIAARTAARLYASMAYAKLGFFKRYTVGWLNEYIRSKNLSKQPIEVTVVSPYMAYLNFETQRIAKWQESEEKAKDQDDYKKKKNEEIDKQFNMIDARRLGRTTIGDALPDFVQYKRLGSQEETTKANRKLLMMWSPYRRIGPMFAWPAAVAQNLAHMYAPNVYGKETFKDIDYENRIKFLDKYVLYHKSIYSLCNYDKLFPEKKSFSTKFNRGSNLSAVRGEYSFATSPSPSLGVAEVMGGLERGELIKFLKMESDKKAAEIAKWTTEMEKLKPSMDERVEQYKQLVKSSRAKRAVEQHKKLMSNVTAAKSDITQLDNDVVLLNNINSKMKELIKKKIIAKAATTFEKLGEWWTAFLAREENKDLNSRLESFVELDLPQVGSLGAELKDVAGKVIVIKVEENSPMKDKLFTGDEIKTLNGEVLAGKNADEVGRLLAASTNKTRLLVVHRAKKVQGKKVQGKKGGANSEGEEGGAANSEGDEGAVGGGADEDAVGGGADENAEGGEDNNVKFVVYYDDKTDTSAMTESIKKVISTEFKQDITSITQSKLERFVAQVKLHKGSQNIKNYKDNKDEMAEHIGKLSYVESVYALPPRQTGGAVMERLLDEEMRELSDGEDSDGEDSAGAAKKERKKKEEKRKKEKKKGTGSDNDSEDDDDNSIIVNKSDRIENLENMIKVLKKQISNNKIASSKDDFLVVVQIDDDFRKRFRESNKFMTLQIPPENEGEEPTLFNIKKPKTIPSSEYLLIKPPSKADKEREALRKEYEDQIDELGEKLAIAEKAAQKGINLCKLVKGQAGMKDVFGNLPVVGSMLFPEGTPEEREKRKEEKIAKKRQSKIDEQRSVLQQKKDKLDYDRVVREEKDAKLESKQKRNIELRKQKQSEKADRNDRDVKLGQQKTERNIQLGQQKTDRNIQLGQQKTDRNIQLGEQKTERIIQLGQQKNDRDIQLREQKNESL